jgi:hypothetical protein
MATVKPKFCGNCGHRLSNVQSVRFDEQTRERILFGEVSLMCDQVDWGEYPCYTQYFLRDGKWIPIPEIKGGVA